MFLFVFVLAFVQYFGKHRSFNNEIKIPVGTFVKCFVRVALQNGGIVVFKIVGEVAHVVDISIHQLADFGSFAIINA